MSAHLESIDDSIYEQWDQWGKEIFGISSSEKKSEKDSISSSLSDTTFSGLSSYILHMPIARVQCLRYDPTYEGLSTVSFDDSLSDVSEGSLKKAFRPTVKNRSAFREFKRIVDHPHIKAHPRHWKERFSPRSDSPIQEVTQNIYKTMQAQKGRTLNLSKQEEKKENIHPSNVSFEHFHDLYESGRKWRFDRYRAAIDYRLQGFEYREILALIGRVKLDEGTFSEEVLTIVKDSSILLECAAKANYWEDISLFVREGGVVKDFGSKASGLQYDKEWVSIYRDAYRAKYGVSPDQQRSSSSIVL